ncbi:F-box protein [Apostasia shenzhenica]|uniref:F-box protein n=1 Tax=Apostasia shenzhenica TaxID=1088818 RepID=A0A2I0AF55_9ASPA|nr:F-box protein [Apostasia shenzhenica]
MAMEISIDFVEWLGPDISSSVLMLLDDPADLVRISRVSRSWRRFVIGNGFCKKLCLRICSEASDFTRVMETTSLQTSETGSSSIAEWRKLEREHRVYSYLSYCIVSPTEKRNCILQSISASSTDNFPDESIENTLEPSDQVNMRPSYWSSEGQRDLGVPETLTYRLLSKLCIIREIKIRPFEAYFQYGNPIYSAKYVRFRMGRSRLSSKASIKSEGQAGGDNYEWFYISPEFPMSQKNILQSFKLPRPVLCIGGILQIELLGRVQVQEMDGLYYICVCHVKGLGHPLTPQLDVEFMEAEHEMILKHLPEACDHKSSWRGFRERIRHLRAQRGWHHPFVNTLLGAVDAESDDDDDDDDDNDDVRVL